VATFGGLMLFTGAGPEPDPVAMRAGEIRKEILDSLRSSLGGETRNQGDDVFLDVWLNFELGQDIIKPGDRRKVARACAALRSLFERDVSLRDEVEIWIEGHTDSIQPKSAATKRDRYLYNWHLSSKRAASVLHEFHACGLDPARYRIFAIGYANTRPRLDLAPSSGLHRRTTFRVRPDRCSIEARLEKRDGKCVIF
jgi:flagellar motor protein MotB